MGVEGQDGEGSHALQPLRELIMMVVLVIPFFQYAIVSVGTGEYLSCSKCVRGVMGSQKGLGGRHDSSISGHYDCTARLPISCACTAGFLSLSTIYDQPYWLSP